ncbi:MAG TPA: hypothetical protein VFA33_05770 [Bryobacteraceae bacterium]|nr:hypothetical protein [Bryobacteraceae bacterium]
MLKLRVRANLKCPKHPSFDPARNGGRGGVKGGCIICQCLCDLWLAGEKLNFEVRLLVERASPPPKHWPAIARAELKRR